MKGGGLTLWNAFPICETSVFTERSGENSSIWQESTTWNLSRNELIAGGILELTWKIWK